MDSFELNKIIGAILGTLLFVMGVGFVAEAIYHPIEERGPGYELPEAVAEGEAGPAEPEVVVPIGTLLASANIDQGAQSISKCRGCHNFEEGAANKQGPGLYGVVGNVIGTHEGFAYSEDLAALGASGETWTYEHLNDFLVAPRDFAPGTKMNFGGLKNPAERANVIAYLSTLSANPVPFPAPDATADADPQTEEEVATEPAPADDEPVAAEPETIETPTETQGETQVQGTPVSSSGAATTTPWTEAPATETPATESPATTMAPATEVPAAAPPAVDTPAAGGETATPQ